MVGRRHPLEDEEYSREVEKLGTVAGAADQHRADEEALAALDVGMGARGGGISGFISEKYPERGKVFIETYDEAAEVPARRVRPTDPEEKERFEEQTGITGRRRGLEELQDRFNID